MEKFQKYMCIQIKQHKKGKYQHNVLHFYCIHSEYYLYIVTKKVDKAIKFVENFGYHREFIIKSLQMNEINHAIATYYLGLSLLNE